MLGWEYPPRFAGGLGKACQGLSQAMAKQGAQIFFVLPTFPERVSETHLEVVGAVECMIEAGWDPQLVYEAAKGSSETASTSIQKPTGKATSENTGITRIQSEAKLFPYGAHPEGEASENFKRILDRMSSEGQYSQKLNSFLRPQKERVQTQPKQKKETTSTQVIPSASEIYGKNLWSEIERFCFTVRHLSETHEVDLVHAHDWMTFPAAFEFQKATGVPVYLHVHATEYDRSGDRLNQEVFRIEREGFRRASHIFAVSRYTAGIIERLYGINRKKISVVYNAPESNTSLVESGVERSREPNVVFLGRLTFQKGPDHFLRAAAMVAQAVPRARFVICGSGDMMEFLRNQAHRLGIERQVQFAGFLEPSEVDKVLLNSRVLVMPSVSEPFGLVALEAILCGIPVVLSKQSGVKEVLQRALVVDFWDHEKLADQIIAALRLPDLSKQLVEDGMDQLRQLSWEKSAQHVMEIYRRHLGSLYAHAIGGAHGH